MAASMRQNAVELGFVEKAENWRLTSPHFPSKIGQKPSWLAFSNLPRSERLQCKLCKKQCIFLLQVYAPIDDRDDTFHRVVFLFVCRNPSCHAHNSSKPFYAFRCQLPRRNEFYNFEPVSDDTIVNVDYEKFGINLCQVCGCDAGSKKCSKCHKVWYCSRDHQLIHWKNGHKENCGKADGDQSVPPNILFPEYEIVTEPEPPVNSTTSQDEETDHNLKETKETFSTEELESMALKSTKDDDYFQAFKDRVNLEPDQVLRYDRGKEPLWVSRHHKPSQDDIPSCQCGAPRIFEFQDKQHVVERSPLHTKQVQQTKLPYIQVMPQLLLHLKVDKLESSIDWGTLAVYTCEASCNHGSSYHEEFVWKQDYEIKSEAQSH